MNNAYKQQVRLLLDVLPEVAKESCLAMHGGTAINLFVRDMPRLSVDIDLTFVELGERAEAINAINEALVQIKKRVETIRPTAKIEHKVDTCKLQISNRKTGTDLFNRYQSLALQTPVAIDFDLIQFKSWLRFHK